MAGPAAIAAAHFLVTTKSTTRAKFDRLGARDMVANKSK